ncbi:MAG: hypothetical protein JSS32_04390 [Verrucomicrobia bacterium]|nr:hypothetical protein [Verrucomicrobiota bacterium]
MNPTGNSPSNTELEALQIAKALERFHLDEERNATVPIAVNPYAQVVLTNGHILKNTTANGYIASCYKDSTQQWHLKVKGPVTTLTINVHEKIMSAAIQTLNIIPAPQPSEEEVEDFVKQMSGMTMAEAEQVGITREMAIEGMREATKLAFMIDF